jgi:hypothetical protein
VLGCEIDDRDDISERAGALGNVGSASRRVINRANLMLLLSTPLLFFFCLLKRPRCCSPWQAETGVIRFHRNSTGRRSRGKEKEK